MRETISALLLAWYDQNARTLPWRGIHDPYRTWVSETMLQQTRVETVRGYYERFLARFPDVAALAEATVSWARSWLTWAEPWWVCSMAGRCAEATTSPLGSTESSTRW